MTLQEFDIAPNPLHGIVRNDVVMDALGSDEAWGRRVQWFVNKIWWDQGSYLWDRIFTAARRLRWLIQESVRLAEELAKLQSEIYALRARGAHIRLSVKIKERKLNPESFGFPSARTALTLQQKLEIFHRDGHRCVLCGALPPLVVDHIVPVSLGGGNDDWNLRSLCKRCNGKKGAHLDVPHCTTCRQPLMGNTRRAT